MELPERETYYRALQSRDSRFDRLLFVGVTSIDIYCGPVCPPAPPIENCRFFDLAATAKEAGFRPCLRCRPETAPDLASWRGTSNTVSRALALIADGVLDGDDANIEALAEHLGVGERHLRRYSFSIRAPLRSRWRRPGVCLCQVTDPRNKNVHD